MVLDNDNEDDVDGDRYYAGGGNQGGHVNYFFRN